MWALGCLLYEVLSLVYHFPSADVYSKLLTDIIPYSTAQTDSNIMVCIMKGRLPAALPSPILPHDINTLLDSCWKKLPLNRTEIQYFIPYFRATQQRQLQLWSQASIRTQQRAAHNETGGTTAQDSQWRQILGRAGQNSKELPPFLLRPPQMPHPDARLRSHTGNPVRHNSHMDETLDEHGKERARMHGNADVGQSNLESQERWRLANLPPIRPLAPNVPYGTRTGVLSGKRVHPSYEDADHRYPSPGIMRNPSLPPRTFRDKAFAESLGASSTRPKEDQVHEMVEQMALILILTLDREGDELLASWSLRSR